MAAIMFLRSVVADHRNESTDYSCFKRLFVEQIVRLFDGDVSRSFARTGWTSSFNCSPIHKIENARYCGTMLETDDHYSKMIDHWLL